MNTFSISPKTSIINPRRQVAKNTPLPDDFTPGNWSVICGRGKDSYDHVGNRRFRVMLDDIRPKYNKTKSRHEKSLMVIEIVDRFRMACPIGAFVKKDPTRAGRWVDVGDQHAREKVGHAIREAQPRPLIEAKNKNPATSNATDSTVDEQTKSSDGIADNIETTTKAMTTTTTTTTTTTRVGTPTAVANGPTPGQQQANATGSSFPANLIDSPQNGSSIDYAGASSSSLLPSAPSSSEPLIRAVSSDCSIPRISTSSCGSSSFLFDGPANILNNDNDNKNKNITENIPSVPRSMSLVQAIEEGACVLLDDEHDDSFECASSLLDFSSNFFSEETRHSISKRRRGGSATGQNGGVLDHRPRRSRSTMIIDDDEDETNNVDRFFRTERSENLGYEDSRGRRWSLTPLSLEHTLRRASMLTSPPTTTGDHNSRSMLSDDELLECLKQLPAFAEVLVQSD